MSTSLLLGSTSVRRAVVRLSTRGVGPAHLTNVVVAGASPERKLALAILAASCPPTSSLAPDGWNSS
jgi:hypothetical protein